MYSNVLSFLNFSFWLSYILFVYLEFIVPLEVTIAGERLQFFFIRHPYDNWAVRVL